MTNGECACRRGLGQQPEVITGELTIAIGRRATVVISTPTKTPSDQASHVIDGYASRIERIIDRSEANPDTIAIERGQGPDAEHVHPGRDVRRQPRRAAAPVDGRPACVTVT